MADRGGIGKVVVTDEAHATRHPRSVAFREKHPVVPNIVLETESSPEQVSQLVNSIIHEDLLYLLARSIHLLSFESRKDSQSIFSYVLRFKPPDLLDPDPPALAQVVNQRPEVIIELCRGYERKESAMPSGVVLREVLRAHEAIAEIILFDQSGEDLRTSTEGVFWNFFRWINDSPFEVSTDAFTTFRVSFFLSHFRDERYSSISVLVTGTPHTAQTTRRTVFGAQLRAFHSKLQC